MNDDAGAGDRWFRHEAVAGQPGWMSWDMRDDTRFNGQVLGPLLTRVEGDRCRVRMQPEHRHSNLQDMIHGGTTLALIDVSLFAAMRTLTGHQAGRAVTLELSTQFIGAGRVDAPLDAVVEVLRETGRTLFLRGTVEQGDTLVAAYSGLVRKAQAT